MKKILILLLLTLTVVSCKDKPGKEPQQKNTGNLTSPPQDCLGKYPILENKAEPIILKKYCEYKDGEIENKKLSLLIITNEEFGQKIERKLMNIGGKSNGGIGKSLYGSIDIANLEKLAQEDWCVKIIISPNAVRSSDD
ncbi:MAG: hypothetical protein GF347_00170 [Candidatus Moranbacteria bacterium]|nr:hypothetical protein [Candidatus Moranbacteria bacterium]